ncbi:hypothetical protein EXU85_32290 [Spirosoma sp. KCTC 42546]|uniref:hypothetical protein n=1 Tax=Spirosoma sp. KCTC 42546 TaxID=2520506 RepID=UPI0011570194|nr:hypothetical protein [Spirosoma sp. KCTC 42546]QDK83034.1 hypothetical protein EXU85_32290 [Spirosoma sp. KCTC 42546]
MKIITTLLLTSLGALILACQQQDDLTNDRPAIKAISFVGIPTQNVRFDAPNARITVQLPAVVNGGLQPVFELTEGTKLLDGVMADNTIDLSAFCACNPSTTTESKKVILRVGNQKTTAVYELVVVATGPLKAQNTTDQFTFSRKTKRLDLRLPVENLYSNPHVDMLLFTNVVTGNVTRVSADATCLNSCIGNAPNQLVFSLGSPIERVLLPGTYTVGLNTITFPQRLVVTD